MIWVADSGSTKTDWALADCDGHILHSCTTQGLNPHLLSDSQILDILAAVDRGGFDDGQVDKVSFYGAGCGTDAQQMRMRMLLADVFQATDIQVAGDLLGACRAVAPDNQCSFVAILGTGSNVCRYDGTNIVEQKPSLGYLLGDEGSGNCLGKRLLKDYIVGRMPEYLSRDFASRFSNPENDFLQRLYHGDAPNRYLASFVPFAAEHRTDPYIQHCVCRNFASFFVEQILPIADMGALQTDERVVYFVGGIANAFRTELTNVANEIGFKVGAVVDRPLLGLALYEARHNNR